MRSPYSDIIRFRRSAGGVARVMRFAVRSMSVAPSREEYVIGRVVGALLGCVRRLSLPALLAGLLPFRPAISDPFSSPPPVALVRVR